MVLFNSNDIEAVNTNDTEIMEKLQEISGEIQVLTSKVDNDGKWFS